MKPSFSARRVLLEKRAFDGIWAGKGWLERGWWPSSWVHMPGEKSGEQIAVFRRRFVIDRKRKVRVHVSADERYDLKLNGQRIGRGPERGLINHWYYESYDIDLEPGEYLWTAKVWRLGNSAPWPQVSVRHGFLMAAEDVETRELMGTGTCEWEGKWLTGYSFGKIESKAYPADSGIVAHGLDVEVDGRVVDWLAERGEGEGWEKARTGQFGWDGTPSRINEPTHALFPAIMKEPVDQPVQAKVRQATNDLENWQAIFDGSGQLELSANSTHRAIIDLQNYFCCYTYLTVTGGRDTKIRIAWAESLYGESGKGNRDEIEGKKFIFHRIADTFIADGERRTFSHWWWKCGRYIEVLVQTGDEPVTIERIELRETRYPLEWKATFDCDREEIQQIIPPMIRSLQTNLHEIYMDCPYYEQQQWIGDTRLQMLCGYIGSDDDRPQRKAIEMFDKSRDISGFTISKAPTRSVNILPSFSLVYTWILHDFSVWRGDKEFIRDKMPGARGILDAFLKYQREDGLVVTPPGWEFVDWAPGWNWGNPPAKDGVSGVMNWMLVNAIENICGLEMWLGEERMASRWRSVSDKLYRPLQEKLWNAERSLFADDLSHEHFSEHSQALALLAGWVRVERCEAIREQLARREYGLTPVSIYFLHYVFSALRHNPGQCMLDRLGVWLDSLKIGLRTTPETAEPTRSDNHAWGAHPLFHFATSILGVWPEYKGTREVRIRPNLGSLTRASGRVVMLGGIVSAKLERRGEGIDADIELPAGVTGRFIWGKEERPLVAGRNEVRI